MAAPSGFAQRARDLPGRVWPGLDERLWNRQRDALVRRTVASQGYASRLEGLVSPGPIGKRPPHLVVVPHSGPGDETWRPGTRNFYFEAAQTARELYPDLRVSVFAVSPGEPAAEWHVRLIRHAVETGATHLITHIESDPESTADVATAGGAAGDRWTWDILWSELSARWDGVLLGVMFDSAFRWLTIPARRLARMSPRFVEVDICMPMDGVLVRGRPEVGPVNMPMSRLSFVDIDAHTQGLEKAYDVSFIGALYPYRVELIDALRARGISVAVNPHRPDETRDFTESRANQPSFLDYMAGLKQSRITINFSRSSAGPFEQLKTRVIEAASMGCLVLTDDRDRTRLFWTPEEYAYFPSLDAVPGIVEALLAAPDRLAARQAAARARARDLARTSFWDGIDDGLSRRGLRTLAG